jgi:hypothetical protein
MTYKIHFEANSQVIILAGVLSFKHSEVMRLSEKITVMVYHNCDIVPPF